MSSYLLKKSRRSLRSGGRNGDSIHNRYNLLFRFSDHNLEFQIKFVESTLTTCVFWDDNVGLVYMVEIDMEKEHAPRVAALGCDVCAAKGDPTMLYGYVGKHTKLCMTGLNCFGWFSGYPWVLFEAGQLVSDLRGCNEFERIDFDR